LYYCSATGEAWTLLVHCKNGLPGSEYVKFTLDKADIRLPALYALKDQLGYAVRDYLYYKRRCGRDVATLHPIDYVRHTEMMVQDNESEKEIRFVLTQVPETTTRQVSITPLKQPRDKEREEQDEPSFLDDPFDANKEWLKELPKEVAKGIPTMLPSVMYLYCSQSDGIPNMCLLTTYRFPG
jgi:hypothetical protein